MPVTIAGMTLSILLSLALAPLDREYGLRRVVVSTYQAISGAGRRALETLRRESTADPGPNVTGEAVPLAFNAIPAIGAAEPLADGEGWTTGEEAKVVAETQRILGRPGLPITATCVRIPVLRAHSESVMVETERPLGSVTEVQEVLAAAEGVELRDALDQGTFPHPRAAAGIDGIHVGRVRRLGDSLSFFLVGDQLRKGAALNAVQIAELHWRRGPRVLG